MSTTFKLVINLVNYRSVQAFALCLCSTEFTIGDRTVRKLYYPKSRAEEIRDELMPDVDLDESQSELFAQYVAALEGIGVDLQDDRLQDTLNAHPDRMEAAIQAGARVCPDFEAETPRFSRPISCYKLREQKHCRRVKVGLIRLN